MTERRSHAGRPPKTPNGGKQMSIYLPVELAAKFRALGGSAWLREQLEAAPEPKNQPKDSGSEA
jgi:hypothetical protein